MSNSEVVINFLDKFSHNLSKKTVVIMDKVSIHTSDRILNKLEEWKSKKLEIFWLPTYSPKHNIMEIYNAMSGLKYRLMKTGIAYLNISKKCLTI